MRLRGQIEKTRKLYISVVGLSTRAIGLYYLYADGAHEFPQRIRDVLIGVRTHEYRGGGAYNSFGPFLNLNPLLKKTNIQ